MSFDLRFDRIAGGTPVGVETSERTGLVGIAVWIRAGSARDPVGKEGLAHLCEHLLLRPLVREGSRAHGLQVETGAIVDATTDVEWVMIAAQAPAAQTRSLVDLLGLLLREPSHDAADVEAEKEVIRQEVREDPGAVDALARHFRQSAFGASAWTRASCETPASLAAIGAGDVRDWYARSLHGTRMVVTAHGPAVGEDLVDLLDDALGELRTVGSSTGPRGAEGPTPRKLEYRPIRVRREASGAGVPSGMAVLAGTRAPSRSEEEYWTALAFEVLMADGANSLLSHWLRREHTFCHGAVSMTEAHSDWGSQYFLVRLPYDQTDAALEHLGRRWRALPESITDTMVGALKHRFLTRALSSLGRIQDRMTLLRDEVVAEASRSTVPDDGLEALVTRRISRLGTAHLLAYVRRYAAWDRVSLVCHPMQGA